MMLICVHTGKNTVIRMIRNSNDYSNFALSSCENPLLDIQGDVYMYIQWYMYYFSHISDMSR